MAVAQKHIAVYSVVTRRRVAVVHRNGGIELKRNLLFESKKPGRLWSVDSLYSYEKNKHIELRFAEWELATADAYRRGALRRWDTWRFWLDPYAPRLAGALADSIELMDLRTGERRRVKTARPQPAANGGGEQSVDRSRELITFGRGALYRTGPAGELQALDFKSGTVEVLGSTEDLATATSFAMAAAAIAADGKRLITVARRDEASEKLVIGIFDIPARRLLKLVEVTAPPRLQLERVYPSERPLTVQMLSTVAARVDPTVGDEAIAERVRSVVEIEASRARDRIRGRESGEGNANIDRQAHALAGGYGVYSTYDGDAFETARRFVMDEAGKQLAVRQVHAHGEGDSWLAINKTGWVVYVDLYEAGLADIQAFDADEARLVARLCRTARISPKDTDHNPHYWKTFVAETAGVVCAEP